MWNPSSPCTKYEPIQAPMLTQSMCLSNTTAVQKKRLFGFRCIPTFNWFVIKVNGYLLRQMVIIDRSGKLFKRMASTWHINCGLKATKRPMINGHNSRTHFKRNCDDKDCCCKRAQQWLPLRIIGSFAFGYSPVSDIKGTTHRCHMKSDWHFLGKMPSDVRWNGTIRWCIDRKLIRNIIKFTGLK